MPTWADDIPKDDAHWQHITLSAKSINGANVRFSPLVDANNVAGQIRHDSVNGSLSGLANKVYVHTDSVYTWYPIHIINNQQFNESIQLWFAAEAYTFNWGAYINIPAPDDMVFIDMSWLGMPTLHLSRDNAAIVAEALHGVANFITAKL